MLHYKECQNYNISYYVSDSYETKSLVIIIPGGPGISCDYLKNAAETLAELNMIDVVLLCLPSHSRLKHSIDLTYKNVTDMYCAFIKSEWRNRNIILIGHSFGAVVAHSISKRLPRVTTCIEFNRPYTFKATPKFISLERKLTSDVKILNESNFLEYWKRIIPLYFRSKPSRTIINTLSKKTYHFNSLKQTQGIRWKALLSFSKHVRYYIVMSTHDYRISSDSYRRVGHSKHVKHLTIVNSGHFPMLDKPHAFIKLCRKIIDATQ